MDTTLPDNHAMWRAIDSPAAHHAFYAFIIAGEAAIAILCWSGGLRLWRTRQDARRFNQAKGIAIAGLTLGILLWFTGFLTIGGEWFLMWQIERVERSTIRLPPGRHPRPRAAVSGAAGAGGGRLMGATGLPVLRLNPVLIAESLASLSACSPDTSSEKRRC